LSDVGHRLDTQRVEDERDGLDDFGVVTRQRRIANDLHQGRDGHRRIEVVERSGRADVDQHLARTHLVALLHLGGAVADGDERRGLHAGSVDLKKRWVEL
jgi:hypothetical protein